MSDISLEDCENCGEEINVTDRYDGDVVVCPDCQSRYAVSCDEDGYSLISIEEEPPPAS